MPQCPPSPMDPSLPIHSRQHNTLPAQTSADGPIMEVLHVQNKTEAQVVAQDVPKSGAKTVLRVRHLSMPLSSPMFVARVSCFSAPSF